ncbi:mechanosensitive ion channel domain-containing protein [Carboxylicivirga linearis]|uniref:Mechanosensitive ion channel n=1 Tax=Carboxylicivirga linearis TaxID=1628157 RepID=A0ABS5JZC5_9BACT|nr:mechanosensitive ion channel domain-containing protein [Carboxylicivirga linearis]MBS2099751.1 mechanosensitive ion channel [Carboxylicivirga linearis]
MTKFYLLIVSIFLSVTTFSQVNLLEKDSVETEKGYFSTVNIGAETEKTQSFIRNVKGELEGLKDKDEIDSLAKDRLEKVKDYRNTYSYESFSNLDFRQTEELNDRLLNLKSNLEEARKELSATSTNLNIYKSKIQELIQKWNETHKIQKEQGSPDPVIKRIESNIADLQNLLSKVDQYNNSALTKQDEITGAILFIDEVLMNINNLLERLRTQIYSSDSPPLWSAFKNDKDSLSIKKRIINTLELRRSSIVSHKDSLIHSSLIYIIIFSLFISLFVFVKKKLNSNDELLESASIKLPYIFISKTISSSFLFSSLLLLIFFPDLTPEIKDVLKLLLIIPLLRILPFVWSQLPNRFFYLSALVFLFIVLTDLFSSFVILSRLLVLVNAVLCTFIFASVWKWLKQNIKVKTDEYKLFSKRILLVGLFSVSLSVIINVIGNNYLSIILFNGAIALVYGGLIIFSSVEVIKSIFELIVRHRILVDLNVFRNFPDEILKWSFKLLTYSAVIYWLIAAAKRYLIYSPIYEWISAILTSKLELESFSFSLGNIFSFVITLTVTIYISRFIRFILEDEVYTHFELPRGLGGAITMLVRLILLAFGFILAFGAAGIDISNITIIFGALGVGIGFGLQNIFNNLVSGLILAFERPIQVGDVLQISSLNLMGEVKEIGIRASVIRTFDGAEVIVPNGNLISNEMVNWTLSDRRRRQELLVGVSYGTDLKTVLGILDNVVTQQEGVMKNPSPFIIFKGFGDSSLDFRVMFWTHFDEGLKIKSEVGVAIDNAFKEANITIPFPQRDLHIYPVNKEADENDSLSN